MKRTIKKTKLQQTGTGQFTLTVPSWIIQKVLQCEKGSVIEWDFAGAEAILRVSK